MWCVQTFDRKCRCLGQQEIKIISYAKMKQTLTVSYTFTSFTIL